MFGQPQQSPFGSPPAPAGFGGAAPGFGSPAPAPFGAPTPGAFGAAPAFGIQAPAPAFGAAAPAPGGFGGGGGFGGATNTFGGGGGGFGAPPAPAPAFGSTGGGFGAATNQSPFGSPAPAPGGLFGSAPAPTGGLFGAPAAPTNTGFGAQSTGFGGGGGGFGAPAPAAGGFGAPPAQSTGFGAAQTPGLFGAPAPSAFGAPAGAFGAPAAPAFGSPAPAPPGSMFGATPAPGASGGMFGAAPGSAGQPGAGGTRTTPFNPTTRQDGTSSINMQSISAMPAYENKSFEELRFEDYSQGNKGSGNAAAPGGGFGGGFGAPAPAPGGGLFGAPAAPGAFGAAAPAPGAFGAPAPGAFGAPAAPGAFGAAAPAPGAFGAPAAGAFGAPVAPGAFGSPAPAPGGFGSSAFGAPAAGGLFGAPAAPAPGGLFGGAPSPAPGAFGAPAPGGGLFGAPAAAPAGGLFGAPAQAPAGGLFGGAPAPAPFGAPAPGAFGAPAAPGMFGAPAPAPGGLFGSTAPAPGAFGSPAPGMYGAPAPAQGGLFGSTAPAPGVFGAPAPGMYGAPAQVAQAPGVYGALPAAYAAPALPPAGSIIPQAANEVLAHQIQALDNKRKEMQKLDTWRGKSPDTSNVVPASQSQYDMGMSSVMPNNSQYSPYRPSPRSTAKVRPRGFGVAPSSATASQASPALSRIGTGGRPMMSPDAYAASSVKRLVIKPDSMTPKPKMRLRLANSPANGYPKTHALPVPLDTTSPSTTVRANGVYESSPSPMQSPKPSSIPVIGRDTTPAAATPESSRAHMNGISGGKTMASLEKIAPQTDPGLDYYQRVVGSPDGVLPLTPSPRQATPPASGRKRPSYVPKLTKPGYILSPSLDHLAVMSEADLAAVTGFSLQNAFGMVEWDGDVDVRSADLDASIVIGQNDVSVYTRLEEEGRKPPIGSKLNRPAVITFFNVFPKNGGASADEDTKAKFAKRIEKSTGKMEADLISYDMDNGLWKIRVEHFSRYGLLDDDETDEEGEGRGTPEKQPIEDVDLWQDQELGMDDAAVVSDVEMENNIEEEEIIRNAEASYATIFDTVKTYPEPPEDEEMPEDNAEDDKFDDDVESMAEDEVTKRRQVSKDDYASAANAHNSGGICSRIASKVFAGERRVPSSTDFGRRFGKSFRVGWSPDGSFLRLCPGGTTLRRCRPVFDDPAASPRGSSYLEIHKAASSPIPSAVGPSQVMPPPRFVLPMSIGNAGDTSSHEALYQTLSLYAGNGNGEGIENLTFSLLASCLDSEKGVRRKEAVLRFFVQACEASTNADINSAGGDAHAAVFAALSGGDIGKACNIAETMGEEDLAVCISTFDAEGNDEITQQVRLATTGSVEIPDDLLRIYKLITGDVSVIDDNMDWWRCFLVQLLYDSTDVSTALEAYDQHVQSKLSPYPSPKYRGAKSEVQCVLYRLLLCLNKTPLETSCAEIIDPSGSSRYSHDFESAFHLASSMAATGLGTALAADVEERLIDGYVTQLVDKGLWYWAVYICFVHLRDPDPDISSTGWKGAFAKEILLRNYNHQHSNATKIKEFLETEVGVPKEWLAEALAMRSASRGDPFEYIGYLALFSPKAAAKVVDDVILPNMFGQSQEGIEQSLALLESFQSELSPLSHAVLNLFGLAKDVYYIAHTPANRDDVLKHIPELKTILIAIESTLGAQRSENEKMKGSSAALRFCPSYETIPNSVMLTEASEFCVLLGLQLKALETGIEISSTGISKNRLTALAWLAVDGYSDKFSQATVIRGLR